MQLKGICLMLLALSFQVTAAQEFESPDQFSQWLTYYYEQPDPASVPNAVEYMSSNGILDNQNAIPGVFGFLAGVIRTNPEEVSQWSDQLKRLGAEHYAVFVLGIWYAALPESQNTVYKALDSNPQLQEQLAYLRSGAPMRIQQIPLEQGPWVLDALWGEFAATGDPSSISRISEAMPWIDVEGDINKLLVGGAANWSLKSNALQQDRVFEIMSRLHKAHPENSALSKAYDEVVAERAKEDNAE